MKVAAATLLTTALMTATPALSQGAIASFGLGATRTPSQTAFTFRWHAAPRPSGFSWAAGLYATSLGSVWGGAGVSYTFYPGAGRWFLRGSFMPGLYHQGNGLNMGHTVEFATGIEVGTELSNGAQLSFLLEHRSNGGLSNTNPGLDTLSVLYSIPLN